MKNAIYILLISLIFAIVSCQEQNDELYLDLDKKSYPEVTFDKSEYFSNLESISLEYDSTSYSILNARIYPTQNDIIAFSYRDIYVFPKAEGTPKLLAANGRGSGEVSMLLDIKLNEDETKLFCLQDNIATINMYDLTQFKMIWQIPIAADLAGKAISALVVDEEAALQDMSFYNPGNVVITHPENRSKIYIGKL